MSTWKVAVIALVIGAGMTVLAIFGVRWVNTLSQLRGAIAMGYVEEQQVYSRIRITEDGYVIATCVKP